MMHVTNYNQEPQETPKTQYGFLDFLPVDEKKKTQNGGEILFLFDLDNEGGKGLMICSRLQTATISSPLNYRKTHT